MTNKQARSLHLKDPISLRNRSPWKTGHIYKKTRYFIHIRWSNGVLKSYAYTECGDLESP